MLLPSAAACRLLLPPPLCLALGCGVVSCCSSARSRLLPPCPIPALLLLNPKPSGVDAPAATAAAAAAVPSNTGDISVLLLILPGVAEPVLLGVAAATLAPRPSEVRLVTVLGDRPPDALRLLRTACSARSCTGSAWLA